MKPQKITEQELARTVIDYLKMMEWEIYQEVPMYGGGKRADIYAVRGKVRWAIETKLSFGMSVLEQAHGWRGYAHLRSVAVPGRRRSSFDEMICKQLGIGLIAVNKGGHIAEYVRPALDRKIQFIELHEEQKDFAPAGNSDCLYYSPFKATCKRLIQFVADNDGCLMKTAIESINHHYYNDLSARGSLAEWIRRGKIKELRVEIIQGRLRVFINTKPLDIA